MFNIFLRPQAIGQLRKITRYYAVAILDAIERRLREEPERTGSGHINRLRGQQETTFRLRVGNYHVFYDVIQDRVEIVQILHNSETAFFYREEKP